jgi:hypothetical protein
MNKLAARIACIAALAATSPAVWSAAYIKFDGIDGESTASATVDQWLWLQAMSDDGRFDGLAPSFAGGVRVASGDIDGDGRWEQLVLSIAEDRAGQQTYYRYELKDVLISSYQTSGAGTASFKVGSFASATMTWLPPLATGGRGDPVVGRWDRATGRFTGDLSVLGAFDDLGAERWANGTLAITAAVPEPGSWALMLLGAAAIGARLRRQRCLA